MPELVFSFADESLDKFFDSMDRGFSIEIEYRYRIRKACGAGILIPPKGGSFSKRINLTAKKDLLTGGYYIIRDQQRTYYGNRRSFSENFFECRTPVPALFYESDNYIIEARAAADLIKRPPPLTVLDMFYRSEISKTKWRQLGN